MRVDRPRARPDFRAAEKERLGCLLPTHLADKIRAEAVVGRRSLSEEVARRLAASYRIPLVPAQSSSV